MSEQDRTYYVETILTVHAHTDAQLQTEHGIRDEFISWLEGLGTTVQAVSVRLTQTKEGAGDE